jgi:hypothetical protein
MEDIVPDESLREHYVWQPPDKPFTIRLAFDVIDRLNVDIMRSFGAVRRRGTEVGGLLLGRIEPTDTHVTVTIDDYEPVPCEYAFGPSYILSTQDLQELRKSLAHFDPSAGRDLYTVGFFRSHTRDDLSLDEYDQKFFREYFPDPLHVAMLVKPYATRAGVAGFFYQESVITGGASPLEFPFRRKDLVGDTQEPEPAAPEVRDPIRVRRIAPEREQPQEIGAPRVETAAPSRDTAARPLDPAPTPLETAAPPLVSPFRRAFAAASEAPAPSRYFETKPLFSEYDADPPKRKSRVGWVVFSIMLVVFGVAVGFQYSGTLVQNNPISSTADPYTLNLTATRVDDNILVKWDRQSLAVKGGWRGLLTITEGTDSKAVQMDVPQLQNGSVLYRHIAPEVQFKLEIFLKEQRSVVETFLWRIN